MMCHGGGRLWAVRDRAEQKDCSRRDNARIWRPGAAVPLRAASLFSGVWESPFRWSSLGAKGERLARRCPSLRCRAAGAVQYVQRGSFWSLPGLPPWPPWPPCHSRDSRTSRRDRRGVILRTIAFPPWSLKHGRDLKGPARPLCPEVYSPAGQQCTRAARVRLVCVCVIVRRPPHRVRLLHLNRYTKSPQSREVTPTAGPRVRGNFSHSLINPAKYPTGGPHSPHGPRNRAGSLRIRTGAAGNPHALLTRS